MSKRNRKIIRRLITVFIVVIIVAGIVLSQSSDRMLKATAVPEEAASPAQSFSQSQNGLVVDVYAPEGAFPADTQMYLTDVSEESI